MENTKKINRYRLVAEYDNKTKIIELLNFNLEDIDLFTMETEDKNSLYYELEQYFEFDEKNPKTNEILKEKLRNVKEHYEDFNFAIYYQYDQSMYRIPILYKGHKEEFHYILNNFKSIAKLIAQVPLLFNEFTSAGANEFKRLINKKYKNSKHFKQYNNMELIQELITKEKKEKPNYRGIRDLYIDLKFYRKKGELYKATSFTKEEYEKAIKNDNLHEEQLSLFDKPKTK